MTLRAYWDFMGNLWESRLIDGVEYLWLLWSPVGPIVGPNCHGRREVLEEGMGPLIGAA